jgi:hypothetical protein
MKIARGMKNPRISKSNDALSNILVYVSLEFQKENEAKIYMKKSQQKIFKNYCQHIQKEEEKNHQRYYTKTVERKL